MFSKEENYLLTGEEGQMNQITKERRGKMYECNTGAKMYKGQISVIFLKNLFNSTKMLLNPEIGYKQHPSLGSTSPKSDFTHSLVASVFLYSFRLPSPIVCLCPQNPRGVAVSVSKGNIPVTRHRYKAVSRVHTPPDLGSGRQRF